MSNDLIMNEQDKREQQKKLIAKIFAVYLLIGYEMLEAAKYVFEVIDNDREYINR